MSDNTLSALVEPGAVSVDAVYIAKAKKGLKPHRFTKALDECEGRRYPNTKALLLKARYKQLKLLQDCSEVVFFLESVPIQITGNTRYRADFLVFWSDGNITFEDVQASKTVLRNLKIKQVEALYPIKITEI